MRFVHYFLLHSIPGGSFVDHSQRFTFTQKTQKLVILPKVNNKSNEKIAFTRLSQVET